MGGYRYVVFAIDEYSRYVFIDFIKAKSDADVAINRIKAAFEATVEHLAGTALQHAVTSAAVSLLHLSVAQAVSAFAAS